VPGRRRTRRPLARVGSLGPWLPVLGLPYCFPGPLATEMAKGVFQRPILHFLPGSPSSESRKGGMEQPWGCHGRSLPIRHRPLESCFLNLAPNTSPSALPLLWFRPGRLPGSQSLCFSRLSPVCESRVPSRQTGQPHMNSMVSPVSNCSSCLFPGTCKKWGVGELMRAWGRKFLVFFFFGSAGV
jgi:hypothetical protein